MIEKNYKEITEYYENMLNSMPGNVYWMDKDLKMAGCNQNVLSMLNLKKEHYIGKTYEELAEIVGWKNGEEQSFKNDDKEVYKNASSNLT